jgi:predicted small secreted protein
MKTSILHYSITPLVLCCFLLTGCETLSGSAQRLAASPAGSQIVATAADKVIQMGLSAGATALDNGNPYLHAVADAIRSNPDGIVDPANVQKIFADYGDPANKTKFKTLALDFWKLAKDAAIRFGTANAAELLAKGLQDGAQAGPRSTVGNGP